jgi:hypothetical protein
LDSILGFSNFYSHGVDIDFLEDALKNTPKKEKYIIEKLVTNLERVETRTKTLEDSLKNISKIIKDID